MCLVRRNSDAAADDPRAEPFVGNVARWYADQPDHGPDLPAISCPLSASLNTAEVYNPASNSWKTIAPMGSKRSYPAAVAL